MTGVEMEDVVAVDAMAVNNALELAQEAIRLLERVAKDNAERAAAHGEVVQIACRMAERLGENDPDTQRLKALLMFQTADAMDRVREWRADG